MLPLDESDAIGQPSFIKRHDIIATVIELIQAAWIRVGQRPEINAQCDEDTIAGALHNEMWVEKKRRGIPGPPQIVNEPATRVSDNSLKPDGFIDFKMFYAWGMEDYFGIECKRLTSQDKGHLAREYVKNGVMRFVTGKYSLGHDWAAMLGFVIDGNSSGCIKLITVQLNKRKQTICMEEDWAEEKSFRLHKDIYRTRHRQHGQNCLMTILHLFLSINHSRGE
jgi:hypothetical protein